MNLTRFENNDLELLIDLKTGEVYASQSAIARMIEKNPSDRSIRNLLAGMPSTEAEIPTEKGTDVLAKIYNEDAIYEAFAKYKPELLIQCAKAGVRLYLHSLAGFQYVAVPQKFSDALFAAALVQKEKEELEEKTLLLLAANKKAQEEIEQQIQLIEIQKPKVEFYDELSDCHENMSLGAFSKILSKKGGNFEGIGEKKLFKILKENKFIRDWGEEKNLPYQQFINSGDFVVIEKIGKFNFAGKNYRQTLITPKGCQRIFRWFKDTYFASPLEEIGCIQQICKDAEEYHKRMNVALN